MRRSSIAAVSLALLAGAPAHAADLYGSMKDDVYGEPEMARFYLRGDIGYSLTNDPDVTEEGIGLDGTELEDTWHAGGGIGVYFNSSWRADVTGDYYFDANIDATHPGGGDFGAGNRDIDVNAAVALVNLYYDTNWSRTFSPYFGGGIGFSSIEALNGTARYLSTDGNDTPLTAAIDEAVEYNFAAAVHAGWTTQIDRGLKLDFGYRYTWLGDVAMGPASGPDPADPDQTIVGDGPSIEGLGVHDFRVGLRYDIW